MRKIIAALVAISFLACAVARAGEKEDRLLAYLESMVDPSIMIRVEDCARSFPADHHQFMLCSEPALVRNCAPVDPLHDLLLEMDRQEAANVVLELAGACFNLEFWREKEKGYHYRSTLVEFGRAMSRLANLL